VYQEYGEGSHPQELCPYTEQYRYFRDLRPEGLLPEGMNLNQELVKQDWCWWYQKYALGDTVLEGLETEAREARKGLWADPQPVPPWEWRKGGMSR